MAVGPVGPQRPQRDGIRGATVRAGRLVGASGAHLSYYTFPGSVVAKRPVRLRSSTSDARLGLTSTKRSSMAAFGQRRRLGHDNPQRHDVDPPGSGEELDAEILDQASGCLEAQIGQGISLATPGEVSLRTPSAADLLSVAVPGANGICSSCVLLKRGVMWGLNRRLAMCSVLLTGLLASATVSAATAPEFWTFRSAPIAVGQGWKAYVIAGHSQQYASVAISFAKGGQITDFSVQKAQVTGNGDRTERIKAQLGRLGSIDMAFTPSGREHKFCGRGVGRNGEIKGSLHFSAGKPFKLDAGSVVGALSDYATESMTSFCSTSGPSGRPALAMQAYAFSNGVSRFFSASRSARGQVYLFGKLSQSLSGGLQKESTVSQTGGGAQFTGSTDLSSATVRGARQFSGLITFHKTQTQSFGANGTLAGQLTASFAGLGKRTVAAGGDQAQLFKF
ncbi:MAG: hypothetical protein ACYC91_06900 [Solirubrobacteraceae bacterium]